MQKKYFGYNSEKNKYLSFFYVLSFFLSIYYLFLLTISLIWNFHQELQRLVGIFDYFICAVFFIEFCKDFWQAKSKKEFLKWGWIDFLAAVPAIEGLRYLRIFRIIKIAKILYNSKIALNLIFYDKKNKLKGLFNLVITAVVFSVMIFSVLILLFENAPHSNIKTAMDAIWWVFTTISTVGYGDYYPVTLAGRLVTMVLMIIGVGLTGMVGVVIASAVLFDGKKR
ncbi:MAG: potassium channel family protein [Alphaproteobacteria bacterium]